MSAPVFIKTALALGLSLPLVWLGWLVYLEFQLPGSGLGADAGEMVVHFLGEWALITLLCAYSVSPLRRLTGVAALGRNRRMVGLFAFTYVVLHVAAYVALYLVFDWSALLEDLVERPYIMVGMAALTCLLLMALTSTRGWQRRLRKNWQRLHRLVYPAIALALIHLFWLTKDGFAEVFIFSLWFVILSAERLWVVRARASHAVR